MKWLEQIYDDIGAALFAINPKSFKVEFCNSETEEITGHTKPQIEGKDFMRLIAKRDIDRVAAMFEVLKNSTQSMCIREGFVNIKRKSGRYIPVELSISRRMIKKKPFFIAVMHDLTELRRIQHEKDEAFKKLTQASKLADIGRLAAGIAHELNNPLAIVQGFTENLDLMVHEGELEPQGLRRQIKSILDASDRMSRIIQKVTVAAGNRSEGTVLRATRLSYVVEDALIVMSQKIKYFEIEVEKDLTPEDRILCDSTQIEQIVINIVNNAVQAMESKVGRKILRIKTFIDDERFYLWISNNGEEISSEVRQKIFTPFFTTKQVGEGTGLGLFLSYNIMKAHEGEIQFESNPEQTVFKLIFPRVSEAEFEQHQRGLCLVVDDEIFFRQIMSRKLERFGLVTFKARSAKEALELLATRPEIHALYVDLRMPEMNGLELIAQVRATNPDVLIFIVTAIADEEIAEKAAGYNVNKILRKPIDPIELKRSVELIDTTIGLNLSREKEQNKAG